MTYGQTNEKFINGKGFKSVFKNEISGNYKGTTNGVLFIKNENGNETILDFQGSYGSLKIEKDSDEVYDVSTKCYYGQTSSGKTEIRYKTYALANGIGINQNGQWYELSAIDGSCDLVINGINYTYKAELRTEYLIIFVEKELVLNNWQYLIKTEHTMNPNNINDLKKKKKEIKILPNSTIVFAIKRM